MPKVQQEDSDGWHYDLVLTEDNYPQVECRKSFNGSATLIIVGFDGFNTKYEKRNPDRWGRSTKGKNVRLSTNQAVALTWVEWAEFEHAINYAHYMLVDYQKGDR